MTGRSLRVRIGVLATGLATLIVVVIMGLLAYLHLPKNVPAFGAVRAAYAPSAALLLDRHGVVLDSERINFGVERLAWVALPDVSPALVTAIVDGEDRRFAHHHGVDWRSTFGALRDDVLARQRRGASTITMQLARLLQRRQASSGVAAWQDKLRQARYALSLERNWSKDQILEAYLNLLGYRGELQGVGAAAQRLAGKTPGSLTLPESLVIAALLPQPGAEPAQIARRACARAQSRQLTVECSVLRDTARTLLARDAAPPVDRLAPQLARLMLKTPGERVVTTLDERMQRITRDIVRTRLGELASKNVRDGAALVVDNATGEVLAYVGSAGPNSRANQVDGVRAMRQAGSTLKPFLYEMAIERRYLTAASLLEDSPLNLDTATGTYIPQDYDHDFKGLVSVRTALASSLNVPAVRTLVLVGVDPFRDRLHALGYAGLVQDGDFYGYALALGSAEVSVWQQAQAYRALARGGLWSPITLTLTEPDGASNRVQGGAPGTPPNERRELAADASYVVTDILGDRGARAVTFGLDSHLSTSFWSAAKTGTSKDMRDNWCVGFTRQYTVAVWVGNFEGDSMHEVSGVTGAAPIWHDIMTELQRATPSLAPVPPAGVTAMNVHFSPAVEPPRREWFVNRDSSAGAARAQAHATIVATTSRGEIARIDSPANGMVIALDPDIPADRQRVPIEVSGNTAGKQLVLNDKSLGTAIPVQLWAPRPGTWHLTLQDPRGQSIDRVFFTVR